MPTGSFTARAMAGRAWYVERLGEYLLSQSAQALSPAQREELGRLAKLFSARGVYHKVLTRQVRRAARAEASPQLVLGEAAPERFTVRENGLQFELSFTEGYRVHVEEADGRRKVHAGEVRVSDQRSPAPFAARRQPVCRSGPRGCSPLAGALRGIPDHAGGEAVRRKRFRPLAIGRRWAPRARPGAQGPGESSPGAAEGPRHGHRSPSNTVVHNILTPDGEVSWTIPTPTS